MSRFRKQFIQACRQMGQRSCEGHGKYKKPELGPGSMKDNAAKALQINWCKRIVHFRKPQGQNRTHLHFGYFFLRALASRSRNKDLILMRGLFSELRLVSLRVAICLRLGISIHMTVALSFIRAHCKCQSLRDRSNPPKARHHDLGYIASPLFPRVNTTLSR